MIPKVVSNQVSTRIPKRTGTEDELEGILSRAMDGEMGAGTMQFYQQEKYGFGEESSRPVEGGERDISLARRSLSLRSLDPEISHGEYPQRLTIEAVD